MNQTPIRANLPGRVGSRNDTTTADIKLDGRAMQSFEK
jgi:hypothetical protein